MTLLSKTRGQLLRRVLWILPFTLISAATAHAEVMFAGSSGATLTLLGWNNLETGEWDTGDVVVTGGLSVDLDSAASTGAGATASSTPVVGINGNPAALGAGDTLDLSAAVAGAISGLGVSDAWALTSAFLDLSNASLTDAYQIFFSLDYSLFATSEASLVSETAFVQSSVDVFTNGGTIATDIIVSDALNGGGIFTSGDTLFFSVVLAAGGLDTLNIFADALGNGIGVQPIPPPPSTPVPEPGTGLLVLAGLGGLAVRRRKRHEARARGLLNACGARSPAGAQSRPEVAVRWRGRSRANTAVVAVAFAVLTAPGIASEAAAQQPTWLSGVTVTRIAQTGDDPPGITGPFTSFEPFPGVAPAIDESRRVVFIARDANQPSSSLESAGVFVGNGSSGVFTVADRTVNSPGVTGPLVDFGSPACTPFGIVFSTRDASFRSVVLAAPQGPVIHDPIAQSFDPIPMTSYVFNGVTDPSMSGGYVSFFGNYVVNGELKWGVFVGRTVITSGSTAPSLYTVALTGDDPPGPVGPFDILGGYDAVANRGAVAAFIGRDVNYNVGIFTGSVPTAIGTRPTRRTQRAIISTGAALPDGGGTFFDATTLAYNGTDIAFVGWGDNGVPLGRIGIYRVNMTTLTITDVFQAGESLPGAVNTSGSWFPQVALSDLGFTAFWARDEDGDEGLFVSVGGQISKIVDTSDVIDGKRVKGVVFGAQGLRESSLAFVLTFTNGTEGVYRADLALQ